MTTWRRAPLTDDLDQSAYPGQPGARLAARRWRAAALWAGTGLALYAFLLRISFSARINSDGANNA